MKPRPTLLYRTRVSDSKPYAKYVCVCGADFESRMDAVKSGRTVSCGCYNASRLRINGKANKTHGHTTNGVETPEYRTWKGMMQRCYYPKHNRYMHYGGRGIRVCDAWRAFSQFLKDMGSRPIGTSIDRINCEGNYEPNNCRWATASVQAINRRKLGGLK